jgi:hypothetical protein
MTPVDDGAGRGLDRAIGLGARAPRGNTAYRIRVGA